jgi:hypothetical protein
MLIPARFGKLMQIALSKDMTHARWLSLQCMGIIEYGEWYTWESIRRRGYDSLLWGPDDLPMPTVRFTAREMLTIGRWK